MSAPAAVDAGVRGVFHAGVTVSDMDIALGFYRDGLGLEVETDVVGDFPYLFQISMIPAEAIRTVFLRVPGSEVRVELVEYRGIERHSASSRPCDPGSGHLCLETDDIGALEQRLRARGFRMRAESPVEIGAGPRRGAKVIYSIDPDGYYVELFQRSEGNPTEAEATDLRKGN
jgi:lactoylglutathione lyase